MLRTLGQGVAPAVAAAKQWCKCLIHCRGHPDKAAAYIEARMELPRVSGCKAALARLSASRRSLQHQEHMTGQTMWNATGSLLVPHNGPYGGHRSGT
jgi:hypothetical protein